MESLVDWMFSVDWILIGLWLIGVGFVLLFATRRIFRVYQLKWYDQSGLGPCEDMEWCQIRQAIKKRSDLLEQRSKLQDLLQTD